MILDDFGLQPLDGTTRIALLQILEDRYGKLAVIITSQLPVAQWHYVIGDPTIADGIMDRLLGNAQRLESTGESMRRRKLKKTCKFNLQIHPEKAGTFSGGMGGTQYHGMSGTLSPAQSSYFIIIKRFNYYSANPT